MCVCVCIGAHAVHRVIKLTDLHHLLCHTCKMCVCVIFCFSFACFSSCQERMFVDSILSIGHYYFEKSNHFHNMHKVDDEQANMIASQNYLSKCFPLKSIFDALQDKYLKGKILIGFILLRGDLQIGFHMALKRFWLHNTFLV